MELRDIGVVGMAVMGSNLALNMADHGFAPGTLTLEECVRRTEEGHG